MPDAFNIAIVDPRTILVSVGDHPIGCILDLKLHVAADLIPPILEVTVPEIHGEMDDALKASITKTIEAVQAHGGQVKFRKWEDLKLDTNDAEQKLAEASIKEQLIPNGE